MKFINKLLEPFNLVLQKRDVAVKNIENGLCFLIIRKFVLDNWLLFDDTILGDMFKEV